MKENTYNMIFGAVEIVLMLPALLLISGGILFSVFHSPKIENILNPELFIFHPTVIIGGLIISIVLNLGIILKMGKLRRLNLYYYFVQLSFVWNNFFISNSREYRNIFFIF